MMKMQNYLDEYSTSHQNKTNKIIHKICVPIIMLTIMMLLDCIPGPISFSFMLVGFSLVFYIMTKTSARLFAIILLQTLLFLFITFKVNMPFKLYFSISLFIIAWIGQFIGHHIEGKRPSFFKDLLFLLIGPVWVWHDLLKK